MTTPLQYFCSSFLMYASIWSTMIGRIGDRGRQDRRGSPAAGADYNLMLAPGHCQVSASPKIAL